MKKIISYGLITGLLLNCITQTTQAVSLYDCKDTAKKVTAKIFKESCEGSKIVRSNNF